MKMNISNNGLNLIKKFEGCRLKAYKCSANVWTIGYGHTKGVKEGMQITQAQAEKFLKDDVKKFVTHVNKYHQIYNFNQNEFDALVSFAFNVGSITQLTNNGSRNRSVIISKIPLYCNANGKRIQGLVNRRIAEKDLFTKKYTKTNKEVAKEVINGVWGNGEERKRKLTANGYNYKLIQVEVNKLLKAY